MSQYDIVRIVRELGGEARPRDIEREAARRGIFKMSGLGSSCASMQIRLALRKGWLARRREPATRAVYYRVTEEAP